MKDEIFNILATVLAIVLLVTIGFGISACSSNAMDREAACMTAGGTLESTAQWEANCVDRQMNPIPGVKNWRE